MPRLADIEGEMIGTCVLMRTRLVSRVITNIYDEGLRSFGISSAQFALLVVMLKMGPATRSEIGRFHHQDRSTLTRNLKIMLAEGWIEEDAEAAKGRSRPVVITTAGRKLLQDMAPSWRKAQARADDVLGDAGVKTITTVANAILFPPTA